MHVICYVGVRNSPDRLPVPLPRDCCARIPDDYRGAGGFYLFLRDFLDDGLLVKVFFLNDGRRCIRAG